MPRLAPRLSRIAGSATVAIGNLVAQKRRQGVDLVSFSVGEPDFDTPQPVKDAAAKALAEGKTKYTPGPGIPELREAVARRHREDNGIPCEAAHVIVSPAKTAIFLSLMATSDRGDEVLLPDPGWVSYEPMVRWTGAKPVGIPLLAEESFRMTPEAVAERIGPKTRVLVLNSPSNPTGGVATPDDVQGLVDLAVDHDLWIVSDEIYQKLIYGSARHVSPASLPGGFERTITVDGVSKAYAMTGWRIGWAVAPKPVWAELDKLQSQSITHCTSFAQYGAAAALTGPQDSVARMRAEFNARRDLIVEGLSSLPGVTCPVPGGAFYAFPRFEARRWGGLGDEELCKALIEKAGVATTPGSSFGRRGKGHLRLSYA
ncbi:MAG TPA: pyridoxal phosphate-dependent aminotransferase, partial [Candidatus Thermoplasmatota archaeon]|nr:pyridoxal phosphate-dependent aminotransferase [Candidatus Thermoplasmatota archaeon]